MGQEGNGAVSAVSAVAEVVTERDELRAGLMTLKEARAKDQAAFEEMAAELTRRREVEATGKKAVMRLPFKALKKAVPLPPGYAWSKSHTSLSLNEARRRKLFALVAGLRKSGATVETHGRRAVPVETPTDGLLWLLDHVEMA